MNRFAQFNKYSHSLLKNNSLNFNISLKKLSLIAICSFTLAQSNLSYAFFSDAEARTAIIELRKENAILQERTTQQDNQQKTALLRMQQDLEKSRQEHYQLKGYVDQIQYNLEQQIQVQKLDLQKANQIIIQLQNQMQFMQDQQAQQAQQQQNKQITETQDLAKNQYNQALQLFKKGQFKAANEAFVNFNQQHTHPDLTPMAYYFLGNGYYAVRNYKASENTLQSFLQNFPNHEKTAEVYLTLSNVALESGNKVEAKRYLDKIIKNYPDNEITDVAKERLKQIKS